MDAKWKARRVEKMPVMCLAGRWTPPRRINLSEEHCLNSPWPHRPSGASAGVYGKLTRTRHPLAPDLTAVTAQESRERNPINKRENTHHRVSLQELTVTKKSTLLIQARDLFYLGALMQFCETTLTHGDMNLLNFQGRKHFRKPSHNATSPVQQKVRLLH